MFFRICLLLLFLVCIPFAAIGNPQAITLIHTNDLHSHLLGSKSGLDRMAPGYNSTSGGVARIAALIKKTKAERDNPVLVVDAGDFLMGTLFHTLCRERSFELRLMKEIGYDVTTFGNHEFDLKPSGLARILTSAKRLGGMPSVVASNIVFSKKSEKDDSLEAVFAAGLVKPYLVLVRNGVRIGFFGLLGKRASEVSPYATPVTFRDQASAAKEMVDLLRKKEKVDLVVCLSHGGVYLKNPEDSEDVKLAGNVPGIDIIISGHTHTPLGRPIIKGSTIIVQAWCYGRWTGILDVVLEKGAVTMSGYRAVAINDSMPEDPITAERINGFKREINEKVLAPLGFAFDQVVAHAEFDLVKQLEASNLGDLVADANRWYVNKLIYDPRDPVSKVRIGIESNGIIRDGIMRGKTGKVTISDLYAVLPLGVGLDDTIGYPMVSVYLYASEIKSMLEVLTSIYPVKGSSFFLHVSGLRVTYNPHRMILDRVSGISIEDEKGEYAPLDYSPSNKALYRVASNLYNAMFLKIVGNFTFNAIKIVPKDRHAKPLKDTSAMLVDADPAKPGIQEAKQWIGFVEYVRSFGLSGRSLLTLIPEKYKENQHRIISEPSWNPYRLLKAGNYLTIIGIVTLALITGLLVLAIAFVARRIRR